MTTASIVERHTAGSTFRPPDTTTPRLLLLLLSLLLLYALFPTRNHYWDGIGFALNIEGLGQDANNNVRNASDFRGVQDIYFNPNHLLFNLAGYFLYRPLHAVFPSLRAHDLLRGISMLLSVATSGLLFLTLNRRLQSFASSAWLTLSMALCATWWKFSTDADVYVPGTFLLMVAAFLVLRPGRPAGWKIGLSHAASMLTHQVAVFFFPAALVGIWLHPGLRCNRTRRKLALFSYVAAAALPVLAAYAWVWFIALGRNASLHEFLTWLASNGGDSYSFKSFGANVAESLRSILRIFFGGRVSLALEYVSPFLLVVPISIMLLSLFRGLTTLNSRLWTASPRVQQNPDSGIPVPFLTTWLAAFVAFQFFFLTEYPYYRLFCVPAIILLLASFIPPARPQPSRSPGLTPSFVVFMATFNFVAYIYPYSHLAATPPMRLAKEASSVIKPASLVLYRDFYFTCDNWMIRYFNPETTWVRVDLSDPARIAGLLEAARSKGQTVWLDTTLTGQFATHPEIKAWLGRFGELSEPWGLVNRKHYIQFFQLRFPGQA